MIKEIVFKILDFKAKRNFSKKCIIKGNPQILQGSHIRLLCGSTKDDIQIDELFRSFGGTLVSQFHGKIKIGKRVKLGLHVVIGSVNYIEIGDGTVTGDDVTIMDNNNHPVNPKDREFMYSQPWDSIYRRWKYSKNSPVIIGENVFIGSGVRIQKGVHIGDGSFIAANCVVTKDVPANSLVAGNPGVVVKRNIDKIERIFQDK